MYRYYCLIQHCSKGLPNKEVRGERKEVSPQFQNLYMFFAIGSVFWLKCLVPLIINYQEVVRKEEESCLLKDTNANGIYLKLNSCLRK